MVITAQYLLVLPFPWIACSAKVVKSLMVPMVDLAIWKPNFRGTRLSVAGIDLIHIFRFTIFFIMCNR